MLYVVPSAWGAGAAKALLDAALSAVWGVGHRSVLLEVIEAQGRARRFYEREGWWLDESTAPRTNGLFRLLGLSARSTGHQNAEPADHDG
jgi:GNAT superfamily N-acetyltransferase